MLSFPGCHQNLGTGSSEIETETDLTVAELPALVRATLARGYKTYKVQEAATIVRANGSTVYEAEVVTNGQK